MSSGKSKNKIPKKEGDGLLWLKNNWPNARCVDHDWTMERYDYPPFIRQYIKENWIILCEKNGGTYAEPYYYEQNKTKLDTFYSGSDRTVAGTAGAGTAYTHTFG